MNLGWWLIVFLSLAIFQQAALGSSTVKEKRIGTYNLKQLKSVRFACQEKNFGAIRMKKDATTCPVYIRAVQVKYEGGFSQVYEFPSLGQSGGAPLTNQVLNVLPGTKCLDAVAVEATSAAGCAAKVDVSVIL